jgi:hypothetical protein
MKTSQHSSSVQTLEHPVFFISNRPEAYEVWGEISHGEAETLARLIAARAAKRFPDIEFKIDGDWHTQDKSINVQHAAAYIESHWQSWAAAMVDE